MIPIKSFKKNITSIISIFLFTLIPFLKLFPIKTFFISTFFLAQSNTKLFSEEFNKKNYEFHRKSYYEFLEKQNYSEAIKALTKLIEIEPNHVYKSNFLNDRGLLKGKLGDISGEENDYLKAISLNKNSSLSYNGIGRIKRNSGDISAALSFFEKAIETGPNRFEGYYNLAQTKYAYLEEKDVSGAIFNYKKAIEVDPNHSRVSKTYKDLSNILAVEKQNFQASIYYASKAISIDPKYAAAYHNRGISKRFIGDQKGACTDLKMALSLGNKNSLRWIKKFCN